MFIALQGKKIHYELMGKGEPILFVHGWGGTIQSLKTLATLASKRYQTILLDLPGFGMSDNPDPDWGSAKYATSIRLLLDTLHLKRIIYFGHSFGGSLGIYLAAHHPQYITKLILSNASYQRTLQPSPVIRFLKKIVPETTPFYRLLLRLFYRIFFPHSDRFKFAHLEQNFRKIMNEDLTPLLHHVNIPTLILWGDEDRETPLGLARTLQKEIKGNKLKVFPGTAHGLPLKYPELVFEEMKKFI